MSSRCGLNAQIFFERKIIMKKLMIAVLMAAVLSGCATENGSYRFAQQVAGVAAGAVVGAYVAKATGGKVPVGGVVGALIGGALANGAQPPAVEYTCTANCVNSATTYAAPPQYQQQYQQQYGNPGVEAAEHRGASEYNARLQCEMESRAYYSRGGTGGYLCSNGYNNGGNNYPGSYYNRNGIVWR